MRREKVKQGDKVRRCHEERQGGKTRAEVWVKYIYIYIHTHTMGSGMLCKSTP
jgi:hypothetical protein